MNTITTTVRDAFNADALIRLCRQNNFSTTYGATKYDLPGKNRFFWHKDNGSKILAVAHLDSVWDDGACRVVRSPNNGLLALSGVLDDRLGVYVILELLPALGISCDWLLTTDEEVGNSTAGEFAIDKQYNWIIQFDRGGTDVVMYEYETKELKKLVKDSGAHVGMGSFSDICSLEHLKCAGFNWGVGYHDYHGPRGYAYLEDTFMMVGRFLKFYNKHKDTRFDHDPFYSYKPVVTSGRRYYGSARKFNYEDWKRGNGRGHSSRALATTVMEDALDETPFAESLLDFCPDCTGKLIDNFCPDCNVTFCDDDALAATGEGITISDAARSLANNDDAAYLSWLEAHAS